MLTEQEKQIIEYGKANGKTASDVKRALAQYRQQSGWKPPQEPSAPADTTMSRVSGVIGQAGSNVADAIAGDGQYAGQSSIRRGVEATAEAFKAVPGAAIAASPEPVRKGLGWVGSKVGAGMNWITDKISDIPGLQKWTMDHPDAAKALEEVAGTAKAGGEIAGTILLADQTAKGLQAGVDATKAGMNKVGEGIQYLKEKAPGALEKGKEILHPKKDFAGTVREVTQASPDDLQNATEAFKHINTEKVKTYADLTKESDAAIRNLSSQMDDILTKETRKFTPNEAALRTDVSGRVVFESPVDDALDQLKSFFKKTNNPTEAAKIEQLANRFHADGLTLKELNDVAKMHGSKLNAYNANGELASGLTKQAAESTRQSIKEAIRQALPDDAAKTLDSDISHIYTVRDLATQMAEKVSKLEARIAERGLLEKIGYGVTKAADVLSGGTLRGIMEGILPRGVGYKVMNALDLESRLRSNLDLIEKALNAKTNTELIGAVQNIVTSPAQSAVARHFASADQISASLTPDKLQSMGGMQNLIQRTQTNIVDGLKAEGMGDAGSAIAKLPASSFDTLDAFKSAVDKAIGGQGGAVSKALPGVGESVTGSSANTTMAERMRNNPQGGYANFFGGKDDIPAQQLAHKESELLTRRNNLIKDGYAENSSQVKQIDKALDEIIKRRSKS